MPREILERKPISIPESKMILEEREASQELSYLQKSALDQFRVSARISLKGAKKIFKLIMDEFGITERGAIFIVNSMPVLKEEVEVLVTGETTKPLNEKDYQAIIDLVDSIRSEED